MTPNTRRKSAVAKGKAIAVIDTTILEKIDDDGDLTLHLMYKNTSDDTVDEDDRMSDVSVKAEDGEDDGGDAEERWKSDENVRFLVSSKHLQMASPVFKELIRTSPELLLFLDDDVDAMRILLNIIHGRVRQVPLKLSLMTVRHVALIVKKYQMMEVVELYVKLWLKELPRPSLLFPAEDILVWLCVCWVFKLPLEFTRITRQAVWTTSSKIIIRDGEHYEFPTRILDKIEAQRKNAIAGITFIVESVYNKSTQGGICPDQKNTSEYRRSCDALILGSLIKSTSNVGLWPVPQPPFHGLTVNGVIEAARELHIQTLCDQLAYLYNVGARRVMDGAPPGEKGSHGWNKSIKKAIEKREGEAKGLELKDFLPSV